MGIALGLSFGYHDSAAAIVQDGKIIAAASEERFSRIKNDNNFPENAINFCMENVNNKKPDIVVYYENDLLKLDRQINFAVEEKNHEYLTEIIRKFNNNFNPVKKISDFLNIEKEKIIKAEHHLSHAYSAFFSSTFSKAAVLVMDGVGEYETVTIFKAEKMNMEKIFSICLPFSVGLLYSAFTEFLGFEVNEGEYKVMGMSGFGEPIYKEKIKKFIKYDFKKNIFWLDEELFETKTPVISHLKSKFLEIFGEKRDKKENFFIDSTSKGLKNKYFADIAASIQSVTEELIIGFAKKALELTGINNLCFAGGVALNSVANGKIIENVKLQKFFVQPASGDSGCSIGAAFIGSKKLEDLQKNRSIISPYLGKNYYEKDIEKAIDDFMIEKEELQKISNKKTYCATVAKLLSEDKVIGWMNGRFEFGPRALGSRSIIASPLNSNMKNIVNEKIKYREKFRPFAPSVLSEFAQNWFETNYATDENSPYNFMLAVVRVKKHVKHLIPAITHVDGTARIQTVRKNNTLYRILIENFHKITEVPLILNTSFNLKGEPIVSSPQDAFKTFIQSQLDVLAIYPFIIYRKW